MGVYLYPSGTETELKNAYIGEYWSPNANTIAYFPLENDVLDKMGNLTLTYKSLTKASIGYLVTGWAKVSTWQAVYYMWGWCNVLTAPDAHVNICSEDNPEMWFYYKHSKAIFNSKVYVVYGSDFENNNYTQAVSVGTNAWHHYAISYENSKTSIYIDWVKKLEYNWVGYNFWNMAYLFSSWNAGQNPNDWTSTAYISDYILESVWWTAQEVASYYNKTKSAYWL